MSFRAIALVTILAVPPATAAAQMPDLPNADPRHKQYDVLLDTNVRDGLVYYRAVQAQRGMLARYIASLDLAPAAFSALSREDQMALLINAYNAIALHSAAQQYPIQGRASAYPAKSIRQISGVYERKHRVAGRSVSLDELEIGRASCRERVQI